ncbi:MAG: hypothetical protein LUQ16_09555 [Methanomassiliicoccales archaeon]|nr:hypothetical protein [Methanomassiliicoccales archaeon]
MTDNTRMCTGCGRQIPAEYNVCPHCGRPQNQQYGPAPGPQPYAQPQQYEPLGAIKYIFYILSFLSLLIGIIIFLIWMNDPNPEKRRVGKNCLYISLAAILLSILCWGIVAAMSIAFW